jgi:hypothetical protein
MRNWHLNSVSTSTNVIPELLKIIGPTHSIFHLMFFKIALGYGCQMR